MLYILIPLMITVIVFVIALLMKQGIFDATSWWTKAVLLIGLPIITIFVFILLAVAAAIIYYFITGKKAF